MKEPISELNLSGLEIAPPQTLGAIRLFPVLNRNPRKDLRLGIAEDDPHFAADVGRTGGQDLRYWSYIPHGLVVAWNKDGSAVAPYGTELRDRDRAPNPALKPSGTAVYNRMVKRTAKNQLRMLPLHLAMEGFLSLHFGGPDIAWSNYSKYAVQFGLGGRSEEVAWGSQIDNLEEALNLFEIHQDQVGMLVFASDALASAFVVSHPDDYRRMHHSLVLDFYGEVITHYARYGMSGNLDLDLDTSAVNNLASLEAACRDLLDRWHDQAATMATRLIDRPLTSEHIYKMGSFRLQRFITDLDPNRENHIGEAIVHQDGSLQYLKTFRLSKNATKRAYLLEGLAANDWNIEAMAKAEGGTRDDLIRRLHNVGYGHLLNPEVLRKAIRRPR